MAVVQCTDPVFIELGGWPDERRPEHEREAMKAAYRKRHGLPDGWEKPTAFGEFMRLKLHRPD